MISSLSLPLPFSLFFLSLSESSKEDEFNTVNPSNYSWGLKKKTCVTELLFIYYEGCLCNGHISIDIKKGGTAFMQAPLNIFIIIQF